MTPVIFERTNSNNLIIWDNTHTDFRSPIRGSYLMYDSSAKGFDEMSDSEYKELLKAAARKAVRRTIRCYYRLTLEQFFDREKDVLALMRGVEQWVGSREDLVFFAESMARGNGIILPRGFIPKIRSTDAVFQEDLFFKGF